jgi:glycosyltransferase involved in cell wall biosynthesis
VAVRARASGAFDAFHVADHTYAQLALALPAARTGVFCHDIDAFRAAIEPAPAGGARTRVLRALAQIQLAGLRRAAVVFHSTRAVRAELLDRGLVRAAARLVHAPYGVNPEYDPEPRASDAAIAALAPLAGRPFLLHVGSAIPRKRIDVLFETFARVRASYPDLALVQQGGTLDAEQRALAERLGIVDALVQPPRLPRAELAAIYRRAAVVLVPSRYEGFGFPVIEALACGAPVVASDLPVLREVGADAALYCPEGEVDAFVSVVSGLLDASTAAPPRAVRVARAREFTWARHARTILDAYLALG